MRDVQRTTVDKDILDVIGVEFRRDRLPAAIADKASGTFASEIGAPGRAGLMNSVTARETERTG